VRRCGRGLDATDPLPMPQRFTDRHPKWTACYVYRPSIRTTSALVVRPRKCCALRSPRRCNEQRRVGPEHARTGMPGCSFPVAAHTRPAYVWPHGRRYAALVRDRGGDPNAAAELLPLVVNELRKFAAAHLADEKTGQTRQPSVVPAASRGASCCPGLRSRAIRTVSGPVHRHQTDAGRTITLGRRAVKTDCCTTTAKTFPLSGPADPFLARTGIPCDAASRTGGRALETPTGLGHAGVAF